MKRSIRRALLLLLTLCMVGAQTAAFAHAIGHLGGEAAARAAASSIASADHFEGSCVECLAFAQVGGGAHGTPPQPGIAPRCDCEPVFAALACVVVTAPAAFDARAPPTLRPA